MRPWWGAVISALTIGRMAAAETPGPVGISMGPWREQSHWVPTKDGNGRTRLCYTRIWRLGDESSLHI